MACHVLSRCLPTSPNLVGEKALGLARLSQLGVPVPEALVLDASEFAQFAISGRVSDTAKGALEEFLGGLRAAGHLPMVSIRCEAKHVHTHDYRRLGVPHTLLNVGIRQCSKGAMSHCSPENIERMSALLVNNYRCRLSLLEEQVGPFGLGDDDSWFEETLMLLEAIYAQLRLVAQAGSLFPTSIIVQRMVFGNLTPASGSGFVCSHNPFTQIDDDFGVFLPCQQGFSLKGGRWGDNEVAFGDLREMNPRAYFQIKGISYCLSRAFGGYRHIEFTIEDKSVYVLDHTTRDVTHQVPTPKSQESAGVTRKETSLMPGRVATHTVNRWAGWDELNRGGHGGHVFNSRSMLELAGAGTAICAELPGGEYGALPVPARDREVRQPSYCFPYFGPVYGTWSGTAPRVAVTRRRILGQILQHLCDQYDYIALPLHPCHTDMVPFIQAGFLVEVRYTYIQNLTTPESTWTANMSSNRLRDLRRTLNNRICFTPDPGCERFNFRNAGFWTDDDAVLRTIQSQVRSLIGSSEGMPFIALDPNGELQGQIFVAWDATRAYALYSWANSSQTSRGVPTRLYWEAMRFVRDNTVARLFDFEGSVMWGVEAFYQSFGGQQVPYYKVYWAKDQSELPTNPYRY